MLSLARCIRKLMSLLTLSDCRGLPLLPVCWVTSMPALCEVVARSMRVPPPALWRHDRSEARAQWFSCLTGVSLTAGAPLHDSVLAASSSPVLRGYSWPQREGGPLELWSSGLACVFSFDGGGSGDLESRSGDAVLMARCVRLAIFGLKVGSAA